MKHSEHRDVLRIAAEVYNIWKPMNQRAPNVILGDGKARWQLADRAKRNQQLASEVGF